MHDGINVLPLLLGSALLLPAALLPAAGSPAQYVVVNIIPGEAHRPIFEEIHQLFKDDSSHRIGAGIGAIFSYLDQPRAQVRDDLLKFLSLAEEFDIPVVVQLDGEQWWGERPDLWNWWEPQRPGYNPQNRLNVEWYGWSPDSAMKIAWRNWGRQIRVLPPPNFMSTRYRAACHDEMRILIPLVLQWWEKLPRNRRHLLIGIKLGWESAIGVNSFYLPDGNALLDLPENQDPIVQLKGELVPDRGVEAIGYAAVSTAKLANGGELQEAHLAEIVHRHLDDLCSLAAELGVPRERLFTHVGGWKEEELLYDAAVNATSCPGWSFYRHAVDVGKDKGVRNALKKNDAPFWAAVEWLLMDESDPGTWRDAIQGALAIPKCRYLCIYNWSGIRDNTGAVRALRSIIGARDNPSGK